MQSLWGQAQAYYQIGGSHEGELRYKWLGLALGVLFPVVCFLAVLFETLASHTGTLEQPAWPLIQDTDDVLYWTEADKERDKWRGIWMQRMEKTRGYDGDDDPDDDDEEELEAYRKNGDEGDGGGGDDATDTSWTPEEPYDEDPPADQFAVDDFSKATSHHKIVFAASSSSTVRSSTADYNSPPPTPPSGSDAIGSTPDDSPQEDKSPEVRKIVFAGASSPHTAQLPTTEYGSPPTSSDSTVPAPAGSLDDDDTTHDGRVVENPSPHVGSTTTPHTYSHRYRRPPPTEPKPFASRTTTHSDPPPDNQTPDDAEDQPRKSTGRQGRSSGRHGRETVTIKKPRRAVSSPEVDISSLTPRNTSYVPSKCDPHVFDPARIKADLSPYRSKGVYLEDLQRAAKLVFGRGGVLHISAQGACIIVPVEFSHTHMSRCVDGLKRIPWKKMASMFADENGPQSVSLPLTMEAGDMYSASLKDPLPFFTYAKKAKDTSILLPRFYFHEFYGNFRRRRALKWDRKDRKKAIFRGSATCPLRLDLVNAVSKMEKSDRNFFDVAVTSNMGPCNHNNPKPHWYTSGTWPPPWCKKLKLAMKSATQIAMNDQMKSYKYIISIDGWASADRTAKLLGSGSVIMLFNEYHAFPDLREGEFLEFWQHAMVPMVNYVPLKSDMSDLAKQVRWLANHDVEARSIAEGSRAVHDSLTQSCVQGLFFEVARQFSKICDKDTEITPTEWKHFLTDDQSRSRRKKAKIVMLSH